MNELRLDDDIMERMVRAVEKVRERMRRATSAFEGAAIPYAVVGGNAVAAWVATFDEAAVRNTQDVDILIRRPDLEAVKSALENIGFIFRHVNGIDMFLDGPDAKVRNSVHVAYAGEKVRSTCATSAPDVSEATRLGTIKVVTLEPLVKMKLTSFRTKDRMHLRDLIDVELLDETWLPKLPAELSVRLKELLDNPEN
jgi:putative nucleotidyltransferase-like protein